MCYVIMSSYKMWCFLSLFWKECFYHYPQTVLSPQLLSNHSAGKGFSSEAYLSLVVMSFYLR